MQPSLPRAIVPTSRIPYFAFAILRAPTPDAAVRIFQALAAREALVVFQQVQDQANRYGLAYPSWSENADAITDYLVQCLARTWQQQDLPIRRRPRRSP
jgi:hypothetical protein